MATGDKKYIHFSNRDTMKYNTNLDYKSGSVVLYTDGKFYEANGDVANGTAWATGTTGATWKAVGGSDIPLYDETKAYNSGDRVFHLKAIWEANSDIAANTSFSEGTTGATWKVVSGLFNEKDFTVIEDTDNNLKTFEPSDGDKWSFGTADKPMRSYQTQYVNFYSESGGVYTNEGNIDADTDSLGLFGSTELALGYGNNNKDMTFTVDGVTLKKDLIVTSGNNIRFEDNDSSGKEGVNMRIASNDLAFYPVNQGTEATTPSLRLNYDSTVEITGKKMQGGVMTGVNRSTSTGLTTVVDNGSFRIRVNQTKMDIYNLSGANFSVSWTRFGATSGNGTGTCANNGSFSLSVGTTTGNVTTYIIGVRGSNTNGLIYAVASKDSSNSLVAHVTIMEA